MNSYHRQHAYSYPSSLYSTQQQQAYPPWTQQVHHKAQPVFEKLEKLTRTCTTVSRCLDTALMSSHSGLTALFRILHQFQSLKHSFGHILGLFSLVRYFRTSTPSSCFSIKEFQKFNQNHHNHRHYWIMAAALLFPFVIHYISLLTKQEKKTATIEKPSIHNNKKEKLDFARARHVFEANNKKELSLQVNDLIAVISRDHHDWWYGRLKNGKMGYFPANHVELIKK